MARQRRGGGFRPPELRGTLGTLLRTTLAQAGTLRDVLERGAREGRSRLDSALSDARSSRRRTDALAELGDIVLDLIRRGEIDLDELPEARDIVAHLDELDADAEAEAAHADEHEQRRAPAPARNRFDTRRRDAARESDNDRDDGTVSSQTWSRPRSANKPKPQPRVWRPPVDDDGDDDATEPPARPSDEITARERPTPRRTSEPTLPARPSAASRRASSSSIDHSSEPARPAKRKDPARKGGIHFDDDEDLADYMHPDDVPPKGGSDGDP